MTTNEVEFDERSAQMADEAEYKRMIDNEIDVIQWGINMIPVMVGDNRPQASRSPEVVRGMQLALNRIKQELDS